MNANKTHRPARKQPKQERSKVTVEAILDGAIRVFDRKGGESCTTAHIAEAAGVSVGTLYQYFSNRDAIIDALQDREFDRALNMLMEHFEATSFTDARKLARAVVSGLLALYRSAPGLHRLLAINGLHVTPTERVQAFDRRVVEMLRAFFEVTPFPIRRENRHAAAFVLYQSVRATLLAAILEEPAGLSDAILIHEVTDLVSGHLVG